MSLDWEKSKHEVHIKIERRDVFESSTRFVSWDTSFVDANERYVVFPTKKHEKWSSIDIVSTDYFNLNYECTVYPIRLFFNKNTQSIDQKFSPFHSNLLSISMSNGRIKLWKIPTFDSDKLTNLYEENLSQEQLTTLEGHSSSNQVVNLKWHPTSSNVLISCSADRSVKFWDIEKGKCGITLGKSETYIYPLHVDFNKPGNLMCLTSRDKTLHLIDPRKKEFIESVENVVSDDRGFRCCYMKNRDKVLVSGVNILKYFDLRKMKEPIDTLKYKVNDSSGYVRWGYRRFRNRSRESCMAFIDEELDLIFVAQRMNVSILSFYIGQNGKIRQLGEYFHIPKPTWGQEWKHQGLVMVPKKNVPDNHKDRFVLAKFYSVSEYGVAPVSLKIMGNINNTNFEHPKYPKTIYPSTTSSHFFSGNLDLDPPIISYFGEKDDVADRFQFLGELLEEWYENSKSQINPVRVECECLGIKFPDFSVKVSMIYLPKSMLV